MEGDVLGWVVAGLIYSFVFGFICATVSSHNGRDSVSGFFVGFLLGVLGLLIVLLMGKNPDGLRARAIEEGTHRPCPHCLEIVRLEAKVCPHCQRDIPSLVKEVVPPWEKRELVWHSPKVEVTKRIIKCPRCTEEWTVPADISGPIDCRTCGHRFEV